MERIVVHKWLNSLERNGLKGTRLWMRLANEQERDLLTADSRLGLMLAKARPLMEELEAAKGKGRRGRAKEAIRGSRLRVR